MHLQPHSLPEMPQLTNVVLTAKVILDEICWGVCVCMCVCVCGHVGVHNFKACVTVQKLQACWQLVFFLPISWLVTNFPFYAQFIFLIPLERGLRVKGLSDVHPSSQPGFPFLPSFLHPPLAGRDT